jgi:hypothetical protein
MCKKGGGNNVYKLVNASIVIKNGKMIMFLADLLLMPSYCSSTLAVVSGVGGQLLRGSSVSACT